VVRGVSMVTRIASEEIRKPGVRPWRWQLAVQPVVAVLQFAVSVQDHERRLPGAVTVPAAPS